MSAIAAVTMGPVAAWLAQLLPHVPCRDTQPRQPAATHAPTAPLLAEQLYVVAAALLADARCLQAAVQATAPQFVQSGSAI